MAAAAGEFPLAHRSAPAGDAYEQGRVQALHARIRAFPLELHHEGAAREGADEKLHVGRAGRRRAPELLLPLVCGKLEGSPADSTPFGARANRNAGWRESVNNIFTTRRRIEKQTSHNCSFSAECKNTLIAIIRIQRKGERANGTFEATRTNPNQGVCYYSNRLAVTQHRCYSYRRH